MLRSKSKDRINDGSGMYMDKNKMGEYLHDLRNNRPSRPTGARPPPSSFISKRYSTSNLSTAPSALEKFKQEEVIADAPPRCASAQSFHRKASNVTEQGTRQLSLVSVANPMAGRPLARPPSAMSSETLPEHEEGEDELPYLERGQRWLERQEAHSLRRALEDMDVKDDKKIFDAAQDEAAELVWKHQNPNAPYKNPDAPYKNPDVQPNYREHLRKGSTHARTASWAQTAQDIQARQLKRQSRDSSASRSVSGGSKTSSAPSSRVPSDSSLKVPDSPITPVEEEFRETRRQSRKRSVQFVEPPPEPVPTQPISGLKKLIRSRTPSPSKALQIEPKVTDAQESDPTRVPSISAAARIATSAVPAHFRNPFSRARESKGRLSRTSTEPTPTTKPLERFEIQRNPPSQSRNPLYRVNNVDISADPQETVEEVKMKDGKEIRSDDIRKATSMSLKDRSAKLPTPTMVSDSPGRPIVSFRKDWAPKEVELKQEVSSVKETPAAAQPNPYAERAADKPAPPLRKKSPLASMMSSMEVPDRTRERASPPPAPLVHAATEPIVPTINVACAPTIPRIAVGAPSVPTIAVNAPSARPVPTIAVNSNPAVPTIAVNNTTPIPTFSFNDAPAVPTIAINDTPSISVSGPSIAVSPPSISVSESPASNRSSRPLPTPKPRPGARHAASAPAGSIPRNAHMTPSGYAYARGSGALCENCALPIAGRIVSAAGSRFHPECFRCHHCGEGLECVAFYPEPESYRLDRVNRIRDRMAGYEVEERPGCSAEEDGDEGLRFYCHLDYHEFFSPRCKSCKTPIEGEVVVACGAEWHVGHFFCAQCGDPFDDKTPFVEKEGYAWCVNCHTNRFSTKCKKCRKPVTDTVVKALDAEWHEKCFCCTECSGPFADGRYFIRPGGMDPYCPACEERRLKA